jgi:hypothetical protein
MNIDYKYVCGTKDPMEIINKNRMRGFGTWLNSEEKQVFAQYSREVQFWNNLYNINSTLSDNEAAKQIFGTLSLNNKMFRPRLFNIDEYIDSVYVDTTNRYNDSGLPDTISDHENRIQTIKANKNEPEKNIYQERFDSPTINQIDYGILKAIDAHGYIVPLEKWVIPMTWEVTNKSNGNKFKKSQGNQSTGNSGESKIKKILSKVMNEDAGVKLGYPS